MERTTSYDLATFDLEKRCSTHWATSASFAFLQHALVATNYSLLWFLKGSIWSRWHLRNIWSSVSDSNRKSFPYKGSAVAVVLTEHNYIEIVKFWMLIFKDFLEAPDEEGILRNSRSVVSRPVPKHGSSPDHSDCCMNCIMCCYVYSYCWHKCLLLFYLLMLFNAIIL